MPIMAMRDQIARRHAKPIAPQDKRVEGIAGVIEWMQKETTDIQKVIRQRNWLRNQDPSKQMKSR